MKSFNEWLEEKKIIEEGLENEPNIFRFHAKRGQQEQVIDLLKQYGEPWTTDTAEGVYVFVRLPHNVSKRSVDRMLRDAGVPGASSGKNVPIIKVKQGAPLDDALERLARQGYVDRKVKIMHGRQMRSGRIRHEPYSDGPGSGHWLD